MKTRHPLTFKLAPYMGDLDSINIPAGATLRRAHNLPAGPDGKPQYWAPARCIPRYFRAIGCPVTWTEARHGQNA